MDTAYAIIAGTTILINAGAAAGDLAQADSVLKTSDEVGVARKWVPLLGLLKGAGAIGLIAGFCGVPLAATAAAAGLTAFFAGALCFHVRARVFHNIAFPSFFLALAVATLVLSIKR